MTSPLLSSDQPLPCVGDRSEARAGRERWAERLAEIADAQSRDALEAFQKSPRGAALLNAVFAHSPFLTSCLLAEPAALARLAEQGPDREMEAVYELLRDKVARTDQGEVAAAELRHARRRTALAVALADLAGCWSLEQVTGALSAFACAALEAALSHLLRVLAERGQLEPKDPQRPLDNCGYVLIGMGKLGGGELNYSSDVDLIALYEPDELPYRHDRGPHQGAVRLTRDLIRLLDERRAEGYVFRTDFRLRPDPSSTPLALPVAAALTYYESLGQNWERAAMIKARPVAGDLALGRAYLEELAPFVWRKHLDFWTIDEVHRIKRRIHEHKGGGRIALAGHNIKLGRGGIREIEFFTQVHQMIWGGRMPELRRTGTLEALAALRDADRISGEVCSELEAAYRFLRRLEHRLQMVDDQQTHSLPNDPEGVAAIAAFLGYADRGDFEAELLGHLRAVERHYAGLFEETAPAERRADLVLTGAEPDPESLEALRRLGFTDVGQVVELVGRWHSGRYRATRSSRSRALLTELLPALLEALAETGNPDRALLLFDRFLSGLPAGVQLFSLLRANPKLLGFLAEIMGGAPAVAEQLSRKPALLEAVLTPGFFDPLPDRAAIAEDLRHWLAQARDFQDVLDLTRIWAHDQRFRVASRILHAACDVDESGRELSAIADVVLTSLCAPVAEQLAETHGRIPGAELAVLAMGRLGAEQLTVASDLDLIFLYRLPRPDAQSDGRKPLDGGTWFARYAHRYVNALTAPTAEGLLYEIDMRLRPSGRSGPIATALDAFARYQTEQAWTWEHMALTRARVVFADGDLGEGIESAVHAVLTARRDPDRLLRDVADMRNRLLRDRADDNPWQIKQPRGGLVDLEFLSQYLQLRHAHDHPEVLSRSAAGAFTALAAAGLLDAAEAEDLVAATRLLRRVENALLVSHGPGFDAATAGENVKQQVARAAGAADFSALSDELTATLARSYALYRKHLEEPAAERAERAGLDEEVPSNRTAGDA